MRARDVLLLLLLGLSSAAMADDSAVYESFSGVTIGRVFLAPGDRDRLDERRLNPPAESAVDVSAANGTAQPSRRPASAGYIISSSGRARVWHDGDFVESAERAPQRMAFPGDVTVTRTVPEDTAGNADTEDPGELDSEAEGDAD